MAKAPASRAAWTRCWAFPRTPDDQIDAAFGGSRAALLMQRGGFAAQLQHLAGHQDPPLGRHGGEGCDHGLERFRIGVVAIVDDRGSADVQHLASLVRRAQPAGGGGTLYQRNTRFEAGRNRRHRIPDVVAAKQRQGHGCLLFAGRDLKPHSLSAKFLDVCGARIGTRTDAEVDGTTVKITPELPHVGVVAVEECDPMSGQALHQLIFGARDARHTIGKILRVGAADVGDDAPIGVSDAGQRRDFAGMRHPHLDHGNFMLRLELEQLQGQYQIHC